MGYPRQARPAARGCMSPPSAGRGGAPRGGALGRPSGATSWRPSPGAERRPSPGDVAHRGVPRDAAPEAVAHLLPLGLCPLCKPSSLIFFSFQKSLRNLQQYYRRSSTVQRPTLHRKWPAFPDFRLNTTLNLFQWQETQSHRGAPEVVGNRSISADSLK